MVEQLFTPLNWVIEVIDKLLIEDNFNDLQRKFLNNISTGAHELRSLLLTIPDISQEKSRRILSFDGRSHLSAIIEHAEELLHETEGELSDEQGDLLLEVHSKATHLLSELTSVIGE